MQYQMYKHITYNTIFCKVHVEVHSQPQCWGKQGNFRGKEQFFGGRGSCLHYYAYHKMIAAKMVTFRFGGKLSPGPCGTYLVQVSG